MLQEVIEGRGSGGPEKSMKGTDERRLNYALRINSDACSRGDQYQERPDTGVRQHTSV